jgi:hypothetical protein
MNEAKSKDLLALSKNQPKKIPSQMSFLVKGRCLRELLRTRSSFDSGRRFAPSFAQDDRESLLMMGAVSGIYIHEWLIFTPPAGFF